MESGGCLSVLLSRGQEVPEKSVAAELHELNELLPRQHCPLIFA